MESSSKHTPKCIIPRDLFIEAVNAAMAIHPGYSVDKWGEAEKSTCRELCGKEYAYIETDLIGKWAISVRKKGLLDSPNGGSKRKKWTEPQGRYKEYLEKPHWIRFRAEVLEHWGFRCALCNQCRSSKHPLEVHHRTYERRGREFLTDCVALCKRCHRRVHSVMPNGNDEVTE